MLFAKALSWGDINPDELDASALVRDDGLKYCAVFLTGFKGVLLANRTELGEVFGVDVFEPLK